MCWQIIRIPGGIQLVRQLDGEERKTYRCFLPNGDESILENIQLQEVPDSIQINLMDLYGEAEHVETAPFATVCEANGIYLEDERVCYLLITPELNKSPFTDEDVVDLFYYTLRKNPPDSLVEQAGLATQLHNAALLCLQEAGSKVDFDQIRQVLPTTIELSQNLFLVAEGGAVAWRIKCGDDIIMVRANNASRYTTALRNMMQDAQNTQNPQAKIRLKAAVENYTDADHTRDIPLTSESILLPSFRDAGAAAP